MSAQLADFNAGVIAQRASKRLLVSVDVASVSRQLATRYERHFAVRSLTFVRFRA